ncbi:MBL fold metallo-hydrolase [Halosegnis marinus]|uniref:MBL fold metallo-hydrolase n=1 Tax=Halosegnis marinus TaxID=3034023 RepID=A0ABD5ZKS6_9EURY|nr:MBL fold metallo-hydrolase [Halosegnis sp. DT85]
MVHHDGTTVHWLGYATIRLAGDDVVVYCDPGRYGVLDGIEPRDGDVVCVTHDHHYDSDGIRRVARDDATVVLFEGIDTNRIDRDVERPADLPYDVVRVDAEADIAVGTPTGARDDGPRPGEVFVRTVPAYNDPDGPHTREDGSPVHPEGRGCGFHLTLPSVWGRDVTAFWPGDSDVLDGHAELDVSLFCPPIGGAFTMGREAAADLAEAVEASLVLPVHYDTFEALEADAEAFVADVAGRGVPVVLDE